jgi:simple sugar transport system permease protein
MQVKTGIPLDLLFFVQALVIMFVAAPTLIRSIYRMKVHSADGVTPQ